MVDYYNELSKQIQTTESRGFAQLDVDAVRINQDFINLHDWDGFELLYKKLLRNLEDPEWTQKLFFKKNISDVAEFTNVFRSKTRPSFEEEVAEFIQSFQVDIKPSFEKSFDRAQNNDRIKAMWYNYDHGGYGKNPGRSQLILCDDYNDKSNSYRDDSNLWLGSKIKKGHPRFKLPKIVVNIECYMDGLEGIAMVWVGILMELYLDCQIILAVCKNLEEIPNRNVPVAISRTSHDIIRFI